METIDLADAAALVSSADLEYLGEVFNILRRRLSRSELRIALRASADGVPADIVANTLRKKFESRNRNARMMAHISSGIASP